MAQLESPSLGLQVNTLPHFIDGKTEALTGHVGGWAEPREEGSGVGRWVWVPLRAPPAGLWARLLAEKER